MYNYDTWGLIGSKMATRALLQEQEQTPEVPTCRGREAGRIPVPGSSLSATQAKAKEATG